MQRIKPNNGHRRFMSPIPSRTVFGTDYTNKEAVIALANRFGKGQTVYKHPERPNYNITHTSRTDLYKKDWVVYQS